MSELEKRNPELQLATHALNSFESRKLSITSQNGVLRPAEDLSDHSKLDAFLAA